MEAAKKPFAVVVGGVNVDVCGTPDSAFLPGDSNPGQVRITAGGVGRNIAENLSRLGVSVRMITALGDDGHAALIRESCAEARIDLSGSFTIPGAQTSTYLCLNDEKGDLAGAVSDMSIYGRLTPRVMESRIDMLNQAALVVLDGNLPEETVTWLCGQVDAPIFADPVSVKKARVFERSLARLTLIKPNRQEASALCGVEIRDSGDLPRVADAFFARGLRQVVVSLGAEGVYYHDGLHSGILPCFREKVVNTTGCGDAFLAAAAAGYLEGRPLREMAAYGLAASAVCARAYGAVNPDITMEEIRALARQRGE